MADNDLASKVDFSIIRYANCWEDADVLLEGLATAAGSKILSIGSAGDNSFSLLTTNPELVVAVDINKTQLHLVELKKAAIKKLTYAEVLQFLGFMPSEKRIECFQSIKGNMSAEATLYWQKNLSVIASGVIYGGKFENYFRMFRQNVLPLIHSKKMVVKLLSCKTKREQELFYKESWNTWRWKLLFKLFFSKHVMGKYGRDPEFMKEVNVSVAQTIYNKAAGHLQSEEAQKNFILHFSLTGHFGTILPHYMRKENFEIIKLKVDQLVIKEGFAQQAIDFYGKFGAMNLSNIFEYMNKKVFAATAESLIKGTGTNGKLAYWNLMVPRRASEIFPGKVGYEKELSTDLTKRDKGFFYDRFIIDRIK
jgi:S-adenosylmethionine-diacylglycerol 3-amino-3-carboxypropyl transferase